MMISLSVLFYHAEGVGGVVGAHHKLPPEIMLFSFNNTVLIQLSIIIEFDKLRA